MHFEEEMEIFPFYNGFSGQRWRLQWVEYLTGERKPSLPFLAFFLVWSLLRETGKTRLLAVKLGEGAGEKCDQCGLDFNNNRSLQIHKD